MNIEKLTDEQRSELGEIAEGEVAPRIIDAQATALDRVR
jgi:hypothetical protein